MSDQKCWFLTVEPGIDFDKLFQEWLENFHFKNFVGKKVIEGFISCDSSDDYSPDDEKYSSV